MFWSVGPHFSWILLTCQPFKMVLHCLYSAFQRPPPTPPHSVGKHNHNLKGINSVSRDLKDEEQKNIKCAENSKTLTYWRDKRLEWLINCSDESFQHFLDGLFTSFWDPLPNRTTKKTQGGLESNANIFISPKALGSLSCLSKFRLKEFGMLRHFTHAKTYRAGGFYNNQRPSVLSSTWKGWG